VLPDADFNLEDLNAMDADVRITGAEFRFPGQLPLENFAKRARVERGVLSLDPLSFRLAGGEIVGKIVLDASRVPLARPLSADFKRVKLSRRPARKAHAVRARQSSMCRSGQASEGQLAAPIVDVPAAKWREQSGGVTAACRRGTSPGRGP
jgi:hypothetical protein